MRGFRMRAVVAPALAFALLTLAGPAGAASYYVNDATSTGDVVLPGCATAPPGNDAAGCGTCESPCATAQYAYSNNPIAPGDTIHVNAGTYVYPSTARVPQLDMTVGGAQGAPVTVKGVKGADGRPLTRFDANAVATAGIRINAGWITIENIVIENTGCPPQVNDSPFGSGVFVPISALPGIALINLEVTRTSCPYGVPIDFETNADPCTGCRIVGCRVYDNGPSGFGGIYTVGASGLEIRGNAIYNNSLGDGLPSMYLQASASAVVENNLIFGNGGTALTMTGCEFPLACGQRDATNVVLRNNTLWNNQQKLTSSAEIVLWAGTLNLLVENNIVGCAKSTCLQADKAVTFAGADYNDWWITNGATFGKHGNSTYSTFAAWKAAAVYDQNSFSVDPLFASATDFHLRSAGGRYGPGGIRVFDSDTSPLLDVGNPATPIGLEPPPNGGRVELGAYGGTIQASLTPAGLTIVAGDGQVGPAGDPLPIPLEVYFGSGPGYPQAGVTISFSATSGGGSVNPMTASTNLQGRASTIATPGLGSNTFVAATVGLPGNFAPVTFTATGTGDAGTPDAGVPDAGVPDAGVPDAGVPDAGVPDAGLPDAGFPDAGPNDGGESAPAPTFNSSPTLTARCLVPYHYAPKVESELLVRWSAVSAPEGATVDEASGEVTWTPDPTQRGSQVFELKASTSSASAKQRFEVNVECPEEVSFRTCGCNSAQAGLGLALVAWIALVRRSRRRK